MLTTVQVEKVIELERKTEQTEQTEQSVLGWEIRPRKGIWRKVDELRVGGSIGMGASGCINIVGGSWSRGREY